MPSSIRWVTSRRPDKLSFVTVSMFKAQQSLSTRTNGLRNSLMRDDLDIDLVAHEHDAVLRGHKFIDHFRSSLKVPLMVLNSSR